MQLHARIFRDRKEFSTRNASSATRKELSPPARNLQKILEIKERKGKRREGDSAPFFVFSGFNFSFSLPGGGEGEEGNFESKYF